MNAKAHWEEIYRRTPPDRVSWYRSHLETSTALIERVAPGKHASVADIGGGESTLVDDLHEHGYRNLTVLDISEVAIQMSRRRLGSAAEQVRWLVGDVTAMQLDAGAFDVWHDRAVFHFLTSEEHRAAYVRNVVRAVRPGGHVIVGTFGPEGPARCSGLEVVRYDAPALHGEFGARFRLIESREELHRTPAGGSQQFLYCLCRVEAS